MDRKRTFGTVAVVLVLGALVYLQVRTWKKFDWATFWRRTEHVNWWYIALAVAAVYAVYALRAVRWAIFLRPVCRTTGRRLMGTQFIGFTALSLLGRAGDMVRPYLVARKERLTFSSQMAVWLVERIFDMGSVAIIFVLEGFIGDPLWRHLGNGGLQIKVEWSSAAFLGGIVAFIIVAVVLKYSGEAVAAYLDRKYPGKFAALASEKIRAFTAGLRTIADFPSLVQLVLLSLLMWLLIALSYWLVVHSYGGALAQLGPASVVLLMIGAMFGSLLQLPGVGGGSQLATIAILNKVFGIENELAVSCGLLIWAATFMSVIPAGLLIARSEQISLRKVAEEEEQAAAALQQ